MFRFILKRERFESIDIILDIRLSVLCIESPTKSYCELWRDECHYTNLQSSRALKMQHFCGLVVLKFSLFQFTLLSEWSEVFRLILEPALHSSSLALPWPWGLVESRGGAQEDPVQGTQDGAFQPSSTGALFLHIDIHFLPLPFSTHHRR